MNNEYWSYLLVAVGLLGFILAGRKYWWCWYINIACQGLWFAYAIITQQWGFIVGAIAYTVIFSLNAYQWTRERFLPDWVGESDVAKLNGIKAASVEDAAKKFEDVMGHPADILWKSSENPNAPEEIIKGYRPKHQAK